MLRPPPHAHWAKVRPALIGSAFETKGKAESFWFGVGVQRRGVSGSFKRNNSGGKGGQ